MIEASSHIFVLMPIFYNFLYWSEIMIRYTNEHYDATKCARIINPVQQALYVKHGAKPIDIYCGYDSRLVLVFNKEETKELFDKWVNHELT